MHSIVLYATASRVCKNLNTLSPSNSPSDTHPLTTKYTCKGGFKFQPVFAGSGFWPGSAWSWGGFNLCSLVLGSRESDPGFYNFSGKSSLKLNHRGGLSLSCWNWNPLLQSGRLDFLEIQRQVGCTS
jgi:hypothetical protein